MLRIKHWSGLKTTSIFSPKNVQRVLTEGPYSVKISDNNTIPLCDTEVTLSGDQFAKHFWSGEIDHLGYLPGGGRRGACRYDVYDG